MKKMAVLGRPQSRFLLFQFSRSWDSYVHDWKKIEINHTHKLSNMTMLNIVKSFFSYSVPLPSDVYNIEGNSDVVLTGTTLLSPSPPQKKLAFTPFAHYLHTNKSIRMAMLQNVGLCYS
jgi:hypothetical protein